MILQYCSDLHLEFPLNEKFVKKYPIIVKGDILLLAGDIVLFTLMDKHKYFFDFVADNFKYTYWVPGNHEYYHSDITQRSGTVYEQIRDNVFMVNNVAVTHDNIDLIFSTLWSHINPANEWQIQRAMSDFHVISYNGHRFSIQVFNQLHADCLQFITREVNKPGTNKKVVVTHHVPTYLNYPEQFKGSVLSEAFATELHDFIEGSKIHSWVYGHHHSNIESFKIGHTSLLTNQLGYVKYGEHSNYSTAKTIALL